LFPLSNSSKEGKLKGVSKNKKERSDVYYSTYYCSPSLSNQRGGVKGGELKMAMIKVVKTAVPPYLIPLSNSFGEGK
jgi:prenyltransferase beta subunit